MSLNWNRKVSEPTTPMFSGVNEIIEMMNKRMVMKEEPQVSRQSSHDAEQIKVGSYVIGSAGTWLPEDCSGVVVADLGNLWLVNVKMLRTKSEMQVGKSKASDYTMKGLHDDQVARDGQNEVWQPFCPEELVSFFANKAYLLGREQGGKEIFCVHGTFPIAKHYVRRDPNETDIDALLKRRSMNLVSKEVVLNMSNQFDETWNCYQDIKILDSFGREHKVSRNGMIRYDAQLESSHPDQRQKRFQEGYDRLNHANWRVVPVNSTVVQINRTTGVRRYGILRKAIGTTRIVWIIQPYKVMPPLGSDHDSVSECEIISVEWSRSRSLSPARRFRRKPVPLTGNPGWFRCWQMGSGFHLDQLQFGDILGFNRERSDPFTGKCHHKPLPDYQKFWFAGLKSVAGQVRIKAFLVKDTEIYYSGISESWIQRNDFFIENEIPWPDKKVKRKCGAKAFFSHKLMKGFTKGKNYSMITRKDPFIRNIKSAEQELLHIVALTEPKFTYLLDPKDFVLVNPNKSGIAPPKGFNPTVQYGDILGAKKRSELKVKVGSRLHRMTLHPGTFAPLERYLCRVWFEQFEWVEGQLKLRCISTPRSKNEPLVSREMDRRKFTLEGAELIGAIGKPWCRKGCNNKYELSLPHLNRVYLSCDDVVILKR